MNESEPRARWWRDPSLNGLRIAVAARDLLDLDDAHEALNVEVREAQAVVERAPHATSKARLRQLCARRAIVSVARRRALERSAARAARDCREKIRNLLDRSRALGDEERAILRDVLDTLARAVTSEGAVNAAAG